MKNLDAYDILIERLGADVLFKMGIDNIVYIDDKSINTQWASLKDDILNNNTIFIRGYGRDGAKTHYFIELYKLLFENEHVKKDSTNNAQPTKLLSNLTQYSKTEKKNRIKIQNYQIAHLFGKTKNPFLFNCSWNIAYIPKFIDPFTGHETQGTYRDDFKAEFDLILRNKFSSYINDYNNFIEKFVDNNLDKALHETKRKLGIDDVSYKRFETDAKSELSFIPL